MKFNFKNLLKIKNIYFIFFLFLYIFTFKAEASIYIDGTYVDNLSSASNSHGAYIDIISATDMTWVNDGETSHGNIQLNQSELDLVNTYLLQKKTDYTQIQTDYIDAIEKQMDDTPEVKADPNFQKFLAVTELAKTIFEAQYDKLFNHYASNTTKQFDFNHNISTSDFYDNVLTPLPHFILSHYFTQLQTYLKDKTSPTTDIIKAKVDEILITENAANNNIYINANGFGNGGDDIIDKTTWFPASTDIPFDQITDASSATAIVDSTAQTQANNDIKSDITCKATSLFGIINDGNCSFVAYIINNMIGLVNYLIGFINSAVGAIFGFIFNFSVIHFADWVTQSNAIVIYKTIILSLVTSLLLPLIFYLVIRMLIDNDSSNVKKLIPKILFTALFVYFSFGISGWVIDQSNIVTIYLYRSMTHTQNGKEQNIGEVMQRSLLLNNGADVAQMSANQAGSPSTIGFSLGQLVVNIVALFVIIQAMVLIFSRSIVLLLCMIFSPLMVLPAGLGGSIGNFIDEWRGKIMKYYSDNLLLGPVFMFLLFLAVKVGSLATNLTKGAPILPGEPASTGGQVSFLSGIMTTILVVILMQVAISVAKKLSGDLGGQISGKINDFVTKQGGNTVFGGAAKVMRGGVGKITDNDRFKGWVQKQQNTNPRLGKLVSTTTDYLKNSTFDARKPLGAAGEALGVKGASTALGKPSTKTFQNTFDKNVSQKTKYIDGLTTKESKEAYINSLSDNISSNRKIKKDFTENKDNKAKEEEFNKTLNKNPALKDHYESLDEDKKKEFTKQYTDPKNKEKNEIETKKINEGYKNKRERGEQKGLEDQYGNKKKTNFFDAIKTDTDLKSKFNVAEDDEKEQEKIIQDWKNGVIKEQKKINDYQKTNTDSINKQTLAIENQTKNFADNMKNFSGEIGSLVDVLKKNQNNRGGGDEDSNNINVSNNVNNPTGGGTNTNSLDELLKANNINRLPKNNNIRGDINNFSQN